MLKQRIISTVILAPIFVATILFVPNNWFKWMLSAILLLGAIEWSKLSGISHRSHSILYAGVLILVAYIGDYFADVIYLRYWVYQVSVAWWLLVLAWIVLSERRSTVGDFSCSVKLLMGLLTLLPVWYALGSLHAISEEGPKLTLYLILLVWAADIGAYFFGRSIGRIKLAPLLSPGKTVEGVAGGLFTALLLASCSAYFFYNQIDQVALFIFFSIVVAAISVVGDLYESVLKRQAGVKDSGEILPGHGGVLDRIDSLTAAAPLYYLFISHLFK